MQQNKINLYNYLKSIFKDKEKAQNALNEILSVIYLKTVSDMYPTLDSDTQKLVTKLVSENNFKELYTSMINNKSKDISEVFTKKLIENTREVRDSYIAYQESNNPKIEDTLKEDENITAKL